MDFSTEKLAATNTTCPDTGRTSEALPQERAHGTCVEGLTRSTGIPKRSHWGVLLVQGVDQQPQEIPSTEATAMTTSAQNGHKG